MRAGRRWSVRRIWPIDSRSSLARAAQRCRLLADGALFVVRRRRALAARGAQAVRHGGSEAALVGNEALGGVAIAGSVLAAIGIPAH